MKFYLNAGFGSPIGEQDLELIKSLGFHGVRQDFNLPDQAPVFIGEIRRAGLEVLALCRDLEVSRRVAQEDLAQGGVSIELGNEQDQIENGPSYGRWARDFYDSIRKVNLDVPIISAGITTTDRKRLDWLERAEGWFPAGLQIGIHTYRTTTIPEKAHPGFSSRDAEYDEVRRITKINRAQRPLHVTEIGWHTAPSTVRYGFLNLRKRKVQFDDAQVSDFVYREAGIAHRNGVETFTIFQLNDGPDAQNYEHRFGIRKEDRSLKPIALRVADMVKDFA